MNEKLVSGALWRKSKIPASLEVGLAALLLVFAGCKYMTPNPYISPRVIGRVLDKETGQPLANARVSIVVPGADSGLSEPARGSQLMPQSPATSSAADGTFSLHSQRDLSLFRHNGWLSVTVSFKHVAYTPAVETYTQINATNTPSGEPVVKTGDILLVPLGK